MAISSSRVVFQDSRDQMLLTMAVDTARAKSKSRDARRKVAKQAGPRGVRYQKFTGRRGDAMEVQEALWERRKNSIRFMERWLEVQLQANAEEGTSRFDSNCSDGAFTPLALKDSGGSVEKPELIHERDVVVKEGIEVEDPGTSGHHLIASFFQVRR